MTQSVKDKMEQRARMEKARDQHNADVVQMDNKIEKLKKQEQQAQGVVTQLVQDNPWIL